MYLCASSLSRFLHMVSLRSDTNKMNPGNLGTVFGPNLMTPTVYNLMYILYVHVTCDLSLLQTTNPKTLIESSNVSASFITSLIRSQHTLFPVTSDEAPPKRLRYMKE